MCWVCKMNGGKENAYKIVIKKPEEKRTPEVTGIAKRKTGPKN